MIGSQDHPQPSLHQLPSSLAPCDQWTSTPSSGPRAASLSRRNPDSRVNVHPGSEKEDSDRSHRLSRIFLVRLLRWEAMSVGDARRRELRRTHASQGPARPLCDRIRACPGASGSFGRETDMGVLADTFRWLISDVEIDQDWRAERSASRARRAANDRQVRDSSPTSRRAGRGSSTPRISRTRAGRHLRSRARSRSSPPPR